MEPSMPGPTRHSHLAGHPLSRRQLLTAAGTLPLLGSMAGLSGCATPLPLDTPAPAGGGLASQTLLQDSALAHGLQAYRQLKDINIAYEGQWRPFIDRVQPEVVDRGFRGASQERLMPALGLNAQHYQGPKGAKYVRWQRARTAAGASVGVWFNGKPSADAGLNAAAAVVADCYALFLLGPLWLLAQNPPLQRDGTERVDGRVCEVLHAWITPGLGRAATDRVTLYIDERTRLTRRIRFTLEGYERTQGAVAEVDTYDHEQRFGVMWPMRSVERVVHPVQLPAHDWRIAGLDVNRGYGADALAGPEFSGAAAAPAQLV